MSELGLSIGERIDDETECMRRAIENKADNLRVAMPGMIVDFDAELQTATVQPLIKEYVRGAWVSLPQLLDVPCFFPRAGGYSLTFPVRRGDECQILFNDMCIDAWWQSGGEQTQLETRRHDLSDAMCFLGITSVPRAVKDYSETSVVLRNEDNDAYIEIRDDKQVHIRSDTTCLNNLTVKGNLRVEGDAHIEGTVTVGKDVIADGDVIAGTVSLRNHVHRYHWEDDGGNSSTQPPTP